MLGSRKPVEQFLSGNELLEQCQLAMRSDRLVNASDKDKWRAGICFGTVTTLLVTSGFLSEPYRFCSPTIPAHQAMLVLRKFLEDNPAIASSGYGLGYRGVPTCVALQWLTGPFEASASV
jgi:hypothetical protein